MNCTLQDALNIIRKWQDAKASLFAKVNVGPVKFSTLGKVSLTDDNQVRIESGSDPLILDLSHAMFNFEEGLDFPAAIWRTSSSAEGLTARSALVIVLFVEQQLVGECILVQLQEFN